MFVVFLLKLILKQAANAIKIAIFKIFFFLTKVLNPPRLAWWRWFETLPCAPP